MGQAKRRGTFEERRERAIGKRLSIERDAMDQLKARHPQPLPYPIWDFGCCFAYIDFAAIHYQIAKERNQKRARLMGKVNEAIARVKQ